MGGWELAASGRAVHQLQEVVVLPGARAIDGGVANEVRHRLGGRVKTHGGLHELVHHAALNAAGHADDGGRGALPVEELGEVGRVGVGAGAAHEDQAREAQLLAGVQGLLLLLRGLDAVHRSSQQLKAAGATVSLADLRRELHGLPVEETVRAADKAQDLASRGALQHVNHAAQKVVAARGLPPAEDDAERWVYRHRALGVGRRDPDHRRIYAREELADDLLLVLVKAPRGAVRANLHRSEVELRQGFGPQVLAAQAPPLKRRP
mmetsp:Transcript_45020/g.128579  ORF Transcript_45020/g.128579 Transcript_45020/m.128579 type:complete len:264 (-) Transcript_45020:1828-2619(-)